jgi:murein DD-endopeptidase MepM/ murein hydrolase activator NlpD
MTTWQRDLTSLELWYRSFEGSRRRRAVIPRLRRQGARRKSASTAVAAAMLAGPAALSATASTSRSALGHVGLASEKQVDRSSARLDSPPYVLLQLGTTGGAVARVQHRLHIEEDGNYGPKTEHAVRIFQRDRGLEVDGVVGPKTWRALFGGGRNAATSARGSSALRHALTTSRSERRASFAVRRATGDELQRLDLESDALPTPRDRSAAVAAIEFRIPALKAGEKSSTSGEDGKTASSSRRRATGDLGRASRESNADSDPRHDSTRSRGPATPPAETGAPTTSGSCGETLKWPTTATHVSSGYRTSQRQSHAGVDIDGGLDDEGNPVYAAACGVITLMQGTSESGGYGNFVCVKHTDRFVTCYAHLSRFADISTGDYVRRGEVIGAVGNTGRSFGAHLHFETRRGTPHRDPDDSDFDPRPYLNGLPIPGEPVTPPSGGVGGPDVGEPEPEPRRSTLAPRPGAAAQTHAARSRWDGGADHSGVAIDALEGGRQRAASESPITPAAKTSGAGATEPSAWEVERHERAAASATRQTWSNSDSRAPAHYLDSDGHLPRSESASSVPEARWAKAIAGVPNEGQSGVADRDDEGSADRQERRGSDDHVTSNRDEPKASLHDATGASTPVQEGADSGVGDVYAIASPDGQTSAAKIPHPLPGDEASDQQSTGHEVESAIPGETVSGRARGTPDSSDSSGTAGAAGEHPAVPPGADQAGFGHGFENRPANRSASGPANGSQGAGTIEEAPQGASLESDPGASPSIKRDADSARAGRRLATAG